MAGWLPPTSFLWKLSKVNILDDANRCPVSKLPDKNSDFPKSGTLNPSTA
jgi:hypothetical protein